MLTVCEMTITEQEATALCILYWALEALRH